MSQDKMQDVFAIEFNFVSGEQADGVKLTGWVKQTDAAFARVVQAIGDPWDYNTHTATAGEYYLSPSKLAQSSLARIIGPSDYISPQGASFNEAITNNTIVTLEANRNSWRIGFPLKKKTGSDMGPNSSSGYAGSLVDLVYGTDITLSTAPSGEFLIANLKTSASLMTDSGDWFIDYNKGIIQTFNRMSSSIGLQIINMNMFGPGTPWGTANVIPSWEQTTNLCTVSGGPTTWVVTLPLVSTGPRSSGVIATEDVSWNVSVPGQTAQHRLPYALTSVLTSGEEIPEGFMLLWDDTTSRILPLTTFYYRDTESVTVTTPAAFLTASSNYRIICTGSSLAENVSWLMSVVRDTAHSGLSNGQDGRTISFTNPISHDDCADLYSGSLPVSTANIEKYLYSASNYPTNPHPQYIHRAGYMNSDQNNSNNAMRGNLVFSGEYDSSNDLFPIGNGIDSDASGGLSTNTYSISFGGDVDLSANGNPRIQWIGGEQLVTSISGTANRIGFGLKGTGFRASISDVKYGALGVFQFYGMPLYMKGCSTSSNARRPYDSGGSIGFDYGDYNELNFMKLVPGYRANSTTYDSSNQGADIGQTSSSVLDITPSMTSRLASTQIREFRFRACSYVDTAAADLNSIGGINSESEFDQYFTSPAIVGSDFFNVYSNAIFFSERGDGKSTSFTTRSSEWMDGTGDKPLGIYYEPAASSYNSSTQGDFLFITGQDGDVDRDVALKLSYYGRSEIRGNEYLGVFSDTKVVTSSPKIEIQAVRDAVADADGQIAIAAQENIKLWANGKLWFDSNSTAANAIVLNSAGGMDIDSVGEMNIDISNGNFDLDVIGAIEMNSSSMSLYSSNDLEIEAGRRLTLESGEWNTGGGVGSGIRLVGVAQPTGTSQEIIDAINSLSVGMLYVYPGQNTLYVKMTTV